VLELTFGVLGDLFGRKKLLVIGSFVMTLGTALTALTHSITPLLIGQAISGIGAAAVFPTSLAVIAAVTPDAKSRARGLVLWTMGMGTGAAIGPVIGGWLGEGGDYRGAFASVAAGTFVIGLLCLFFSGDSRAADGRRLDWGGQVTIVIALVAILYAIIQSPTNGWLSGTTLGVLAVGVVFLAAFVAIELRFSHPLFDLRLFKNPTFTGASLVAVIALCGFLGSVFSVSIRMGVIQNQSSLRVGLYTVMLNIIPWLLLPALGGLLVRLGFRVVICAGLVSLAAGQFWLSALPIANTGLGALAAPLMLVGLGFVLIVSSISGAAVNSVELHLAGMASGAINMVRDLGQTLGIAVAGTIGISAAAANVAGQLAASHLPPQVVGMATGINKAAGTIALAHIPFGAPGTPPLPAPLAASVHQAASNALWHGFSLALTIMGVLSVVALVITVALIRNPRQSFETAATAPAEA
jgi:hypothetical protein